MKYMKDYKQFLAEGGEIRNIDGSIVTELHQWLSGQISVWYRNSTRSHEFQPISFKALHTFSAPRERVKTWHCMDDYGRVSGFSSADTPRPFIGYTICEKQDDGTWKVIETTLKPNT